MVAPPSPHSPSLFPPADVPVDDEDVADEPEVAFEDEDVAASVLDELDELVDAGAAFTEGALG